MSKRPPPPLAGSRSWISTKDVCALEKWERRLRLSPRFRPCAPALVELQRRFAATEKGAVLDGRDIGTVICPDASVKIFVTASPETRAQRRALELAGRGEKADYQSILADVRKRDERDASRSAAPLKPAADAVMLDTSDLDVEEAFRAALVIVERAKK